MAVPTFVGIPNGSLASGALTAQPWFSPHQIDDICVSMCGTSVGTSGTHTTPSGFTLTPANPSGFSSASASTSVQMETAYKRAVSTSEANIVWGTDIGAQYMRNALISGCKTSGSPINVDASGVIGTGTTSLSIATGMTTTVNDSLILLCVVLEAAFAGNPYLSTFSNSNLTNVALQGSVQFSTNNGIGLHIFTGELVTAGAVGTWSITSPNSTLAAWWCGAMESANPSGGGAATPSGRQALLGVGT